MKKTFRKTKKSRFRKTKKSKFRKHKSRKMRGGYDKINKGTWDQVVFNDDEKKKIKDYVAKNSNRTVSSTEILDNLFPDISENDKINAGYEIQVVLGRDYAGR